MHWYDRHGNPRHDAGLRVARKDNLLPSVTTVLGFWKSSFLEDWGANQRLFKFCDYVVDKVISEERTPEQAMEYLRIIANEEDKSDYRKDQLKMIKGLGNSYLNQTADFGTAVHYELEQYNLDVNYEIKEEYKIYCEGYLDFYRSNIKQIIHAERTMADVELLAAGTVDLVYEGLDGFIYVLDYKTRKLSGTPSTDWRFKDCAQMSVYAKMIQKELDLDYFPKCVSFGISTNNPGETSIKYWKEEKTKLGLEYYQHMAKCWCLQNNYFPK